MIKILSMNRKKYKKNLFSKLKKNPKILQFCHYYNTVTVKKLKKFTIMLFL
jgi:hypothetical protein